MLGFGIESNIPRLFRHRHQRCFNRQTGEILEAYAAKDSRLQVFHLPENRGEPFACQFAMDMLKDVEVEYVARMDADDICALDRFENRFSF